MTGKLSNIKERFATFRQNFYNFEASTAQRMMAELSNDSELCDERLLKTFLLYGIPVAIERTANAGF